MESTLAGFIGLTLGLVVAVFGQTMKLQKRLKQLSIVDAKLDVLLKQAGIEFDPFEHAQQEVIDALKSGSKIEAVRIYKESCNVSLKEAKESVEEIQRRTGLGG
jgi:ribosomal protein L7/L12